MPFNVDSTMSAIDVKLSGEGPKLTIRNPLNEIVSGDDLVLENFRIVSVKNPMPGRWTVEAESISEYSVQMGANSELKIEYGFSTGVPKKHGETSVEPMKGFKNVLSFFVQDPSKIRYLSNATLVLENDDDIADASKRKRREINTRREIRLKLTRISENVYVTEPFDSPIEEFKVQLNGVDSNGNKVQRLVSTSLETVEPSAPEVSISTTKYEIERHEKLSLKCIVKSLIAVNIQWFYHDNQSNELEVIISQAHESSVERYVCKAINNKGSAEKSIEIEIVGGNVLGPETTTEKTVEPIKNVTENLRNGPMDVSTNAPTDSQTDEPIDEPVDELTDKPTNELTDKPTYVPIKQHTDGPIDAQTNRTMSTEVVINVTEPQLKNATEIEIKTTTLADISESNAIQTETSKCSTPIIHNFIILFCGLLIFRY
ncbi:unnamed protein product [Diamesa serratosioi]